MKSIISATGREIIQQSEPSMAVATKVMVATHPTGRIAISKGIAMDGTPMAGPTKFPNPQVHICTYNQNCHCTLSPPCNTHLGSNHHKQSHKNNWGSGNTHCKAQDPLRMDNCGETGHMAWNCSKANSIAVSSHLGLHNHNVEIAAQKAEWH